MFFFFSLSPSQLDAQREAIHAVGATVADFPVVRVMSLKKELQKTTLLIRSKCPTSWTTLAVYWGGGKKKCLRLQMFIKAHLHFNSKKKKWAQERNGYRVKRHSCSLEDLKLLKGLTCVLHFLNWSHMFLTHSPNLLSRDVLSAPSSSSSSPLFGVQKPQLIACLAVFLPDFIRDTAQKPYRGPVFISQLWMSENTFARLSTSQFARQESSPLPSSAAAVCSRGVCVGRQRFSNAFFVKKI